MEDGGHYGDSAVHEGGRGDGDQGRTEGKGEFRVFKVGLIEIEIIYSAIYEAFALEIYLKLYFYRSREALYSRPGAVAEDKNCAIM